MEQLVGRACEASDLYGLGVTLIFLLTHTDPINIPFENMKYEYRELTNTGDILSEFIDKCTEPNPGDRFENAAEAYGFLSTISQGRQRNMRKNGKQKATKIGDEDFSEIVNDDELRKFVKEVKKEFPKYYDDKYDDII